MTIKSDRWIRRMCEEHDMISPFEPGQVRQSPEGQKTRELWHIKLWL